MTIKVYICLKYSSMKIIGEIGWNVTLNSVTQDFENNYTEEIDLHTQGGDVFEGFAIYNFLKDKDITVNIVGLCASMGTMIACAANKVRMSNAALFMVHAPSTFAWGNKGDLTDQIDVLSKIEEIAIDLYIQKTGKSREEITALMDGKDHWFTAQEAKDFGFVDEIYEDKRMQVPSNLVGYAAKVDFLNCQLFNMKTEAEYKAKVAELEAAITAKDSSFDAEKGSLLDRIQALEDENIRLTLDLAKGKGMSETEIEMITALAKKDAEKASEIVAKYESKKVVEPVAAVILASLNNGSEKKDDRSKWSYEDWSKQDPSGLAEMQASNPDKFNQLLNSYIIK